MSLELSRRFVDGVWQYVAEEDGGGSQTDNLHSATIGFTEEATAGSTLPITAVTVAGDITYAITAVDQGAKTFTIAGDHEDEFLSRAIPASDADTDSTVAGSTGNDGSYTITDAVFGGGNTVVTVLEAVPSAVADGTLSANYGSITVAGDHRTAFLLQDLCVIEGSSGNDDFYNIVASPTFGGGNTTVLLGKNSSLDDATADGEVRVSQYRATLAIEAGTIVDSLRWFPLAVWAADVAITVVFDDKYSYTGSGVDVGGGNLTLPYDPARLQIPPSANFITLGGVRSFTTNAYELAAAEFVKNSSVADIDDSFPGPGVRYEEATTLHFTCLSKIASPPVTPTGRTEIKVLYWPPQTPTEAVFA